MRIRTLHSRSRQQRSRAAACLQVAGLLLALVASAACLSGVASDARANVARETQKAAPRSDAAALAARPDTMSAALLPEPGAWMMSTLGLLGLEWMARRKRVV